MARNPGVDNANDAQQGRPVVETEIPASRSGAEELSVDSESVTSAPTTATAEELTPTTPTLEEDWVIPNAEDAATPPRSLSNATSWTHDGSDFVDAPEHTPTSLTAQASAITPDGAKAWVKRQLQRAGAKSYNINSNVNGRDWQIQGSGGGTTAEVTRDSSGRVRYLINGREVDEQGRAGNSGADEVVNTPAGTSASSTSGGPTAEASSITPDSAKKWVIRQLKDAGCESYNLNSNVNGREWQIQGACRGGDRTTAEVNKDSNGRVRYFIDHKEVSKDGKPKDGDHDDKPITPDSAKAWVIRQLKDAGCQSYNINSNINGRDWQIQGSCRDGDTTAEITRNSSGRVRYFINGDEVDKHGKPKDGNGDGDDKHITPDSAKAWVVRHLKDAGCQHYNINVNNNGQEWQIQGSCQKGDATAEVTKKANGRVRYYINDDEVNKDGRPVDNTDGN